MLRIAVQAKGRLFEETMALLEESDIKLSTTKRTLLVQSSNFPIEVLFLRDDDILSFNGFFHMITSLEFAFVSTLHTTAFLPHDYPIIHVDLLIIPAVTADAFSAYSLNISNDSKTVYLHQYSCHSSEAVTAAVQNAPR